MLETSASLPFVAKSRPALPETEGWPLVGSLPQILKDPFAFFAQARERYGDIYRLNLGLTKVVVLNHPRHAQHVLRDQGQNYRKGGPMWDAVRGLLGNGLVVSEGDFWLRQRRMMQPHFHRQRLAGLTDLMVEAIEESLDSWEAAAAAGEPVNLHQHFNQLTMRVIVRTLFGSALSREDMEQAGRAIGYALDYIMTAMITHALPGWLPLPGKKRYQQALAEFDEVVYRIIAQSRAGEGEENHLLAMLLNTVDEETGEGMSDKQLRDEVATIFLAGYETTSIVLTWAYDYLSQQPAVMAKLQAEVHEALQGRRPTFADLPKLPYTKMVLQEAMRIRPPSYWLPRTAVADDEMDGYDIPAGTNVISLTYMYHHHPEQWPDPERFDPERFTPEQSAGRHAFAWVPFGAGQRLCIGRDFSLMEGQLALAMMVQRFDVRRTQDEETKPQLSGTLRPKNGLPVILTRRND
ncbi:MAG: cytochrome P450 [Chloroflexi bacterium]|nr:cytochrome P450 [Chloroflexota bacterium]